MRLTLYAIKGMMKWLEQMRMVEIEGSEEFEAWFLALADKEAEAVARVVGLLEETFVPRAERLWAEYLAGLEKKEKGR